MPATLTLKKPEIDIVAQEELTKFFQVAARRQPEEKKTNMPVCYMDTFWHDLLSNPEEYEMLCTQAVGCPVEHLPAQGEGVLDWVPTYEAMFGPLAPVWFTDSCGQINKAMHEKYQQTGVVRASWDCGPAIKDPTEKRVQKLAC